MCAGKQVNVFSHWSHSNLMIQIFTQCGFLHSCKVTCYLCFLSGSSATDDWMTCNSSWNWICWREIMHKTCLTLSVWSKLRIISSLCILSFFLRKHFLPLFFIYFINFLFLFIKIFILLFFILSLHIDADVQSIFLADLWYFPYL